ncbi:hypothetical protein T07_6669 [Trichinella nelsoni]|uniref:Uncharacterized protein n=1 Tax=Trichinella nelsoni TaxID=6336 RepID=A0A0V0RZZ9_9BILA|nr:hypothetical protein T07_6669 [Trichinella nelsoni]
MERRFKESLYFGNRYSVGLLWKSGMANLPNNYTSAIRRYRALEKRLSRLQTESRLRGCHAVVL